MLTNSQINFYKEKGYLFLENIFSDEEINLLYIEIPSVKREDSPCRILEKTGTVRSVFGLHQSNQVYSIASRLEKVVKPATQLLESDVYVHQSKLNTKEALIGDWWEWHQDFPYWKIEDGMPSARVLTAMLFLDEVNEFNGPMFIVPASHKGGVALMADKEKSRKKEDGWYQEYQKSTAYMSTLTSDLKYTIDQDTLKKAIEMNEIVSIKGGVGSILFFHGNLFHASSSNHSPWDRNVYLVTYNSIENTPISSSDNPRPSFISARDFDPVKPLPDDALTGLSKDTVK